LKYRYEIDGLRAIAVIPVIFFHAGYELFSGGFVGVDVFFVISGYLITTILINDIENKKFCIFKFYERRARRILPALFFVMLVCIPFAWMWMLPDPLENFGQSIVAATLSVNNILLFITSGYWELASEFKPLLHTWSLGVEEQFYFVFPIFLVTLWKLGRRRIMFLIGAILLLSLIASELASRVNPQAGFYLIHTRAWELLSGSMAAFVVCRRGVKHNNILATIGLGAIVLSIFYYDEMTPFPSIYSLVPVLGVVLLVLYADKETFAAKLLSTKLLVGMGLISYSAYLWHQPLFAFAKIYSKVEPPFYTNTILILITIFLAYFSWKYIEKPFRNSEVIRRRPLIIILTLSSILLLVFGYSSHKTHGFVSRVFEDNVSSGDIYISYNARNFEYKSDAFENGERINVLVIGNSFGRDMINILRETYDMSTLDLVYRDDFDACSLLDNDLGLALAGSADLIIFASNYSVAETSCNLNLIKYTNANDSKIFFIGTKHFGFNHNWISRTNVKKRALLRNPVLSDTILEDKMALEVIPSGHYISLMKPLTNPEGVLVTDEFGRLISPDRRHLTKYGAIYLGREIVATSPLNPLLMRR
jgi:peptidoglycan/LPS O-acetylase OafA/YrhL